MGRSMNIKALLRALESAPAGTTRTKAMNDILEFNAERFDISRRDLRSAIKSNVAPHTPENPYGVSLDPEPREIRRLAGGYTEGPLYHSTSKAEKFTEFDPNMIDMGVHADPDPFVGVERVRKLMAWDLPGVQPKDNFRNILKALDEQNLGEYYRDQLVRPGSSTMSLYSRVPHDLELRDMGYWAVPHKWRDDPPHNLPVEVKFALEKTPNWNSPMEGMDFVRDILRQHDVRGIKYVNDVEGEGGLSTLNLVPSDVRSKFATFDPRSWTSSHLMRGVPPATLALLLSTLGGEGAEEEA